MKKYFLFATSLLLMLGSCSQDELANVSLMSENGKTTIVASIEGQPSTRMTVAQDGSLSWETNDNFIVFGGTNVTFTTTEQNAATGVFIGNGSPEAGSYAAYYPFNNTLSISENTLTVDLLASYNSAETFKAPMWGKYSEGSVSFKHLGAALEFSYADIPDGYSTLVVEASTPINGCFTATLTDDEPVLATTATVTDENRKVSVMITENRDGIFYVPLPVGTYDLKVYAQGTSNADIELKSWNNLTIERKGLYYTTATYVTIEANTPEAVSSLIADIKDNTIVDLIGAIDATDSGAGSMTLPNVDATYNFTETPKTSAEKPLTIIEAVGSDGSNVNINMPAEAIGLHAVINTPNSTVSIEGGTYESLEATTATNTLIIGEGVTIKNLIVEGGNVVLKGNVENIESDEATIITLDKNITLANACTIISGDITLDLNGHSIKPTYIGYGTDYDAMFIINVGAKLTIEDSSAEKTGIIDTDDGAISQWKDAHCVTAIKLNGTENYSSVPVSSFVLNGGKIKGTAYGISGNGSRGGTEVTINGGVVDSYHSGAAIFNPQMGTVTVTGGEIISTVGIEMRSGTLNVTGGTITARAEYALTPPRATASGASFSDGYILGVSQHTTNNPLNINISGGTFNIVNAGYDGSETYYALYEEDLQDEDSDNITMSITGGTFTGKIKSENCEGFVKGGTFSDASVFDFLADNANVTLGANITLSSVVNIKKTVTINLNGKDIIHPASSGDAYGDVFDVLTGGNLTIMGEGRVISENGYSVYAGGDAKVLLEKGKYYSPVSAVYAQKAAVVTIVGGEYYADVDPTTNTPEHSAEYGHNFTINLRDKKNNYVGDTSEIIIKGGKFYKFDPANNAAEGVGTNFVADGYVSTQDGDYYVVTIK